MPRHFMKCHISPDAYDTYIHNAHLRAKEEKGELNVECIDLIFTFARQTHSQMSQWMNMPCRMGGIVCQNHT